ncbi:EmrB/QacA subfamily drug resistance transporter [Thermobifida halotolerans]
MGHPRSATSRRSAKVGGQAAPGRSEPTAVTGSRPGLALIAVSVVQFMVSLDLSVVNVGLPEIAAGLGFTGAEVTWVVHAYALTFGGLLLLGGKAADRYGRKQVLLSGLALFAVASLAGGFAQDAGQLVAARAAQGVGAAALAPAALALLTETFPSGPARLRAFGVWSAMNAAGGALGILIGGALTEYAGWRWVMFVNVPMALGALAMARWGVAAGGPVHRDTRPDVLGAVLATAGMTLLVFGIVNTEHASWTAPVTVTTLALAVVLLIAFVAVERTTSRDPLVRLGLFANRSVAGANAYNLLLGAAMASAFYFVSLHLQQVLGHGPALTGVMFLPFALGVIAGSVAAVRLGAHLAPRTLMITGGLATAAGFAWFGRISPDGSFLTDVLGPSVIVGLGFGLCLGPVVSTATAGVDPQESGVASGLLNSSRQIGAALGLAVLGTAASARTGSTVTPETLADGYALGLSLCAALFAAAVLIALFLLPPVRTAAPEPVISADQSERNHTPVTQTRYPRQALAAMYLGLTLTVAAVAALYIDQATANILAAHIRSGYPSYSQAAIDTAATTYIVYLTVLGVLGVLGWLVTIWAAGTGKRWVRWAASALFVTATSIALFNLLVRDTSGDTGLPPLLGWAGVLPCLAGLAAVLLLWRKPKQRVTV